MKNILLLINNFFRGLGKCLSGNERNIYKVWFLILLSVLVLVIFTIIVTFIMIQNPSEEELFLLVENDSGTVLNRGLMDEVLEFYSQREVESESIKESNVRLADPSR